MGPASSPEERFSAPRSIKRRLLTLKKRLRIQIIVHVLSGARRILAFPRLTIRRASLLPRALQQARACFLRSVDGGGVMHVFFLSTQSKQRKHILAKCRQQDGGELTMRPHGNLATRDSRCILSKSDE